MSSGNISGDHIFDPHALDEEPGAPTAGSSGASPEREVESSLRPQSFREFVGQARVLDNLGVALSAARE